MDAQLNSIILSLRTASEVLNFDAQNPIVHRLSSQTQRQVIAVVFSYVEPTFLILPLNVLWVDMRAGSPTFMRMLQRQSKLADAAKGTIHTWQAITLMSQYYTDQYYDAGDIALLDADPEVPNASVSTLGIARLSVAPVIPTDPIAVGEGDPRLTDSRQPLSHTHPEKPATQLKTKTGSATIEGNTPVARATLVANSPTSVGWRQLTQADIA